MDNVIDHIHRSKIFTWVFLVSSQRLPQNNIDAILNSGCSGCSHVLFFFLIDHKNDCVTKSWLKSTDLEIRNQDDDGTKITFYEE